MQTYQYCQAKFEILPDEKEFIQKAGFTFNNYSTDLGIPKSCPDCRQQIRNAHRNEQYLHHRNSDLSGRKMISIHPPKSLWGKEYKIYSPEEWYSDQWDGVDYGRDYDFSRSFFEQYAELHKDTPKISLVVVGNENCPYVTYSGYCKNCHLTNCSDNCEDCLYSKMLQHSKNCVDCSFSYYSELCYECFNVNKCYKCIHLYHSNNSANCHFSENLKGCKNCFLCTNLVNKEYYFLNQPLSKEEYETKISQYMGSHQNFENLKNTLKELSAQRIHKYANILNSENCTGDFLSNDQNCFNCYDLIDSQDCRNLRIGEACKDCYDCNNTYMNIELSYEYMSGLNTYHCAYSLYVYNSSNILYSEHMYDCKDCFACNGLRNKQYCIFNKQYSKEEYEKFIQNLDLGSYSKVKELKKYWQNFSQNIIVKETHGTNLENCSGDYLINCKNTHISFESNKCEDAKYCTAINNAKSCQDYSYWGQNAKLVYECQACGFDIYNLRFCNLCWTNCSNLTYCDQCLSCQDCFACVGLQKKQYCIFNKQYSKEEYEELVPRIIEHMKSTQEWGEFFPINKSIYAYNESLAQEQYPLKKEEITNKKWIYLEDSTQQAFQGPEYTIPDNIKDVPQDITQKILKSTQSPKLYKIIPQELKFYKDFQIPIPRLTADERHLERQAKANPRELFPCQCDKCQTPIQTTYSPDRPETVYCEKCYLETIY